ncbi:MAG TPA: M28 family peptidase [Bryobacteraceae bacterium]|nr:M28 family peptidase [Bryobacteraceae bacterium]
MARIIWLSLLVLLPAAGQKISLRYGTVSREDVERRLNSFQDSNVKREQTLKQLFEEAGCTGEQLSEQPVQHSKTPNLICTLPGETDSVVLVGGHFDFVERGKGVVDNWSGSSLLPSLFLSVKAVPRRHTFVFVAFTDEEKGMVGSKFYVHELGKQRLAKISAMVNIDSIGTGPTKVELDRADRKLANALGGGAAFLKMPLSVVNVHQVGASDSDSFQDKKVPAISIHSLTQETWPILHSWRDQLSAIKLDDYYNTYLLLRVYLAELDQILDAPAAQ